MLIALLKKRPPRRWLAFSKAHPLVETFAMNVSQIYDAEDDNPVEMTITSGAAEAGNG